MNKNLQKMFIEDAPQDITETGNVKNLSRQDRIEEIAFNKFQLHSPSPESLIVYIGDVE